MKFRGRGAIAHCKINVFVLQKRNNIFLEKILLQLDTAKYY